MIKLRIAWNKLQRRWIIASMVWFIIKYHFELCVLRIWFELYMEDLISETTILKVFKNKTDQIHRREK